MAPIIRRHRRVDDRLAGDELRDALPHLAKGRWKRLYGKWWGRVNHIPPGTTGCTGQSAKYGSERIGVWPKVGFRRWCPDDPDKVRLFVLVYSGRGCDSLPAVSHLPFLKMWKYALKSVR